MFIDGFNVGLVTSQITTHQYLLAGLIATATLVVLITVKARGYLREAHIKA